MTLVKIPPELHKHLISCSLVHYQQFLKISLKCAHDSDKQPLSHNLLGEDNEPKFKCVFHLKCQGGGARTQIKRVLPPPRYGLIDSCCGQSSPLSHVALSRSLADN